MDQSGYDAVWLAEHHFSSFSHLPVDPHDGRAGRGAHQEPAHRHRGLAGALLPSAASGRRGGAARRPVGRPRQLGRRARLSDDRVPGLRRAARGQLPALSRERAGGDRGLDQGACKLQGSVLAVRRHRGAAQAGPEAAPAGLARRLLRRGHQLGGRERLLDHDRPALEPHADRREAGVLSRGAGAPRVTRSRAATCRWRA